MTEEKERNTIVPVIKEGDYENATAQCRECDKELRRIKLYFEPCPDHPNAQRIISVPGTEILTGTFKGDVRPFDFHSFEPDLDNGQLPNLEAVFEFCCGREKVKVEKIKSRYLDLRIGNKIIKLLPQVDFIDKKIKQPFLQAQSSYLLKNYLATITLCGTVCEMLANLAWETRRPFLRLNGTAIDDDLEKGIFKSKFQDLKQEDKIRLLLKMNIIDQDAHDKFDRVKMVRNQYVHFHKTNSKEETQKTQAAELFRFSQELACEIIGQDFSNGRLNLSQAMFSYLQRNNLIQYPFNSESTVHDGSGD